MYTVYCFDYCGSGVGKSAAFFKTKEEAENAQKNMIETANKNGRFIKTLIEPTNELADKIRKMVPTAAIYYFDELIAEIDKLQSENNELKNELKELTKDQ